MARIKPKWRSFPEARKWAQSLELKSEKYWRIYRKNGLPQDIPSNPNREYSSEWNGWGDWLGTGRIADQHKVYKTYREASDWAKAQGIKKLQEWRERIKDANFPSDIPMTPDNTYKKEWKNWGEFLQTGYIHYKQRNRVSYYEAKAWAKKMGVLRSEDWDQLSTNGLIPPEIPVNISKYYKEWNGWADFLDNQIKGGASIIEVVIGSELKQFLAVDDSIRSIPLKNGKSKRIDIAVPSLNLLIEYDGAHWHKNAVDKDESDNQKLNAVGWTVLRVREKPLEAISSIDVIVDTKDSLFKKTSAVINRLIELKFLKSTNDIKSYLKGGTLSISSVGLQSNNWLTYKEAKEWVRKLKLSSEAQWRKYKSSGVLPNDIPATPEEAYKTEWRGWGDFLGTGNKAPTKNMKSFAQARSFVRGLKLKDSRSWRAFVKTENCPEDIPSNPDAFYEEWISWMNWLGTENTAKRKRDWLSFSKAVEVAKSLGLKSEAEWRRAKKSGGIPPQLPFAPEHLYKKEWKGWGFWLGTGNIKNGSKKG